ncbi:hypothetical protein DFJ74DRAFT_643376 [Hyaloraphidium curvatum]|nr:hypothetical protein DFJ74DRAFT_643376 [Hyaloraphidium curvatum]
MKPRPRSQSPRRREQAGARPATPPPHEPLPATRKSPGRKGARVSPVASPATSPPAALPVGSPPPKAAPKAAAKPKPRPAVAPRPASAAAPAPHSAFIASSPRPLKVKRDDRPRAAHAAEAARDDVDSGASDSGTTFGQPPKKRTSPASTPRVKASPGKRPPRSSLGPGRSTPGDSESDSENVSIDLASMQDSLREMESAAQAQPARPPPKRVHVPRVSAVEPAKVSPTSSPAAPSPSAPAAAPGSARVTRSQAKTQQTELFSPTYHLTADAPHPHPHARGSTPSSSPRSSRHPSPTREPPSSDDEDNATENDENRSPDDMAPNSATSSASALVARPSLAVAASAPSDPEPAQQEHAEHHHGHHSHMEVDDTVEDPEAEDDDDSEEFDPFWFIRNLPPYIQKPRPAALPRKTRSSPPITLVLDLDETLVHCSTSPLDHADITFPIDFNGQTYEVSGRLRPHWLPFLERASQIFEVVVFTASQRVYADRLLNMLDPKRQYIKYRLFREHCLFLAGNYLKDLNILGRDLGKIVIVDNSPQAFGYQLTNGIPITSWYEDTNDRELLNVLDFLETIQNEDDVRPLLDRQYRMRQRVYGASAA